jgi:hypothetical protein
MGRGRQAVISSHKHHGAISSHWWQYWRAQSLELLVNWSPLYQPWKIVHLAADLLVQHPEMTLVPDQIVIKRFVV